MHIINLGANNCKTLDPVYQLYAQRAGAVGRSELGDHQGAAGERAVGVDSEDAKGCNAWHCGGAPDVSTSTDGNQYP